ncbi:alcohol dehydrogenase catalytic domain-containing protein [Saccharopolyspora sp. WRP15-2]|uniref:Alcohol dehydrogenase catalytic domain-containing protein n=1 Tax=Saccharopolyspora oryzae TaxID=2997343 RepID=A0ABT4UWM1_9PSEU|nr:alcohol dehydrogenase catalytic domain-containing protein [Saccharopolyspora oryzae]MDA3626108.1 alcohol dehydrogenase catalytic domain-containing protein [Saccharopolyspora oryzae]
MDAVALTAPERVEIIDVPKPDHGPNDVLVRMLGVGLCGTDTAVVRGGRKVPQLPWVLGHEGVGEIVEVGGSVRDRRVGQRVAIEPNYCCLRCDQCRTGFTSGCRDRIAVGLTAPGVLADHVVVPAAFAHPVADHVSIADLVCTEPLTVARAAVRRSGVQPGHRCLVVGAGSQGLFVCQSLLEAGIAPSVQEPHPGRRELALSLGAVPDEPGRAVDHVFETSGAPGALESALERLVPGGRATLVGMNPAPVAVSSHAIVSRQWSITGSLIYDHPGDFADTIAMLEKGAIQPHRVLQARFSLHDAADAFASVRETPGKCWISFEDDSAS